MIGRLLFDVMLNAAVAFASSALLVVGVARLTRRWAGPWHLALFALPFLKALVELGRGVPDRAFLWAHAGGAAQDLGSFQIGVGAARGRLLLQAQLEALSDGIRHPTSIAELAARGAIDRGFGWAVETVGVTLAGIAVALVARRLVAAARFERRRRRSLSSCLHLDPVRVGHRTVRVYVDPGVEGTPFSGGLVRPYICIPLSSFERLSPGERRAVIAHELAHVRRLDVLWVTLVGLLTSALWYCPGVRTLSRRFCETIEHGADAGAVRSGTSGPVLASAILRLAALRSDRAAFVATLESGRATRARVHRLLERGATARATWRGWLFRIVIAAVTANTILFAVFLGNH